MEPIYVQRSLQKTSNPRRPTGNRSRPALLSPPPATRRPPPNDGAAEPTQETQAPNSPKGSWAWSWSFKGGLAPGVNTPSDPCDPIFQGLWRLQEPFSGRQKHKGGPKGQNSKKVGRVYEGMWVFLKTGNPLLVDISSDKEANRKMSDQHPPPQLLVPLPKRRKKTKWLGQLLGANCNNFQTGTKGAFR